MVSVTLYFATQRPGVLRESPQRALRKTLFLCVPPALAGACVRGRCASGASVCGEYTFARGLVAKKAPRLRCLSSDQET